MDKGDRCATWVVTLPATRAQTATQRVYHNTGALRRVTITCFVLNNQYKALAAIQHSIYCAPHHCRRAAGRSQDGKYRQATCGLAAAV